MTGPEAIDPAGPGRAVQFNCDAIYGVHLDTGSADFIQSSFMPPTSTDAAVPRVLIGLPCVHVTGASVADAEFWLQNLSTDGSDVCFQITENPVVIMKRQSLHVKDNAIYDHFTKQQVI